MPNKIPNVTFREPTLDCIHAGLAVEQVKSVVFDKFLPNIKIAIEKNKKECIFCTVGDFSVVIPKSSYKTTLDTVEKYYVSKEDYTKSAIIRDLSAKIKE